VFAHYSMYFVEKGQATPTLLGARIQVSYALSTGWIRDTESGNVVEVISTDF
jgi:hypothetical protein